MKHLRTHTTIPPGAVLPRWDSKTRRWRLYVRGTRRLVPNRWALPADGGGHHTETQALKQARAINHGLRQAAKHPPPDQDTAPSQLGAVPRYQNTTHGPASRRGPRSRVGRCPSARTPSQTPSHQKTKGTPQ